MTAYQFILIILGAITGSCLVWALKALAAELRVRRKARQAAAVRYINSVLTLPIPTGDDVRVVQAGPNEYLIVYPPGRNPVGMEPTTSITFYGSLEHGWETERERHDREYTEQEMLRMAEWTRERRRIAARAEAALLRNKNMLKGRPWLRQAQKIERALHTSLDIKQTGMHLQERAWMSAYGQQGPFGSANLFGRY
jgi:hypothetical protein